MAKKFLPAVNVTLFRPYLWEVNNPVMLLSALESLAFLLLTFWAVRRRGFVNSLGLLRKNPFLVFCLLFTVVFSFAVGISTYNFGSLVRYKIPILPFYGVFLILLSGIKNRRKYFIQNLSSVTRELHLNFRASAKGSK
jgi:TRAP-type mannitol/chloroaromatic compound transport system permease small subunit